MFGYVVPYKNELANADWCLYRAFYCGICKATGRLYGQMPRFTTNYDIVFLSVLLHDYKNQDVTFENKGCVCNPFKKKTTVCHNELLDKLVAANIILAYYKATDDVIDDGVKKKFARSLIRGAYNKARATSPECDEIVRRGYERLRKMESEKVCGVDRVSDCFATLLMELATYLLGGCEDEKLRKLCYNVGKFVYITDALDDVGDDYKHKRYNPLLAQFGAYASRKQFIQDNRLPLEFMFATTVNRAIECFNGIIFVGAHDLLANIVQVGLRKKVEEIFESEKKLQKPRI